MRGDLQFLRSLPSVVADVENDRRRAAADLVRLGRMLRNGLGSRLEEAIGGELTRERLRAAAVAYVSNMRDVRSQLSAKDLPCRLP